MLATICSTDQTLFVLRKKCNKNIQKYFLLIPVDSNNWWCMYFKNQNSN